MYLYLLPHFSHPYLFYNFFPYCRKPCSWIGLPALGGMCLVFQIRVHGSWAQCTFQFLRYQCTPSGGETFRLRCVFLHFPFEIKEMLKLDRTIGFRH